MLTSLTLNNLPLLIKFYTSQSIKYINSYSREIRKFDKNECYGYRIENGIIVNK